METKTCTKCGSQVAAVGDALVVVDPATTADGLSYCPPNPDAPKVGNHRVRKAAQR